MFSLKSGLPIARVKGGNDDGAIIYLQSDPKGKVTEKDKEVILEGDGKLQVLPNIKSHEITFIAGPTASGKSTYGSNYIKEYMKDWPEKKIVVFSSLPEDEPLDKLGVTRIDVEDEEIIENPITVDEFNKDGIGSLLVFDDYDSISNKGIKKCVADLLDEVIKRGRYKSADKSTIEERRNGDVDTVIMGHQILNYKNTREILNESTSVVMFPSAGATGQIVQFLKRYQSLNKKAIERIVDLGKKSRWVAIYRRFPQYVIWEKGAYLLSKEWDEKPKKVKD